MEARRYISLAFWAKERHEQHESLRDNVVSLEDFAASMEHHTTEAELSRVVEISGIEEAA